MDKLKEMLSCDDVRGVVRTLTGGIIKFHNPGVKDLFELVETRSEALEGASVADRVIGRGAALLLALGHVGRVYAQIISEPAVLVLQDYDIEVEYDKRVPNIINRNGTDICPVENLTMAMTQPEKAFTVIKEFLINNNIIES